MHFYTWLKRCLEQIQRCLCFKSSLNWVQFGQADSGVVEEKSDNLQSYVWRTNQDYRTYRHQSNGPMVMVQTSTHTFHVSIYISKHKPQTVTILAHNHMMSLLALPGGFGEACRLQRVFHGSVPLLHERDIWRAGAPWTCSLFSLSQPSRILLPTAVLCSWRSTWGTPTGEHLPVGFRVHRSPTDCPLSVPDRVHLLGLSTAGWGTLQWGAPRDRANLPEQVSTGATTPE